MGTSKSTLTHTRFQPIPILWVGYIYGFGFGYSGGSGWVSGSEPMGQNPWVEVIKQLSPLSTALWLKYSKIESSSSIFTYFRHMVIVGDYNIYAM
jgi:hypothetical protein